MQICIPGCPFCIPVEGLLGLIALFLWNPIAKLLGLDKKKVKEDDVNLLDGSDCHSEGCCTVEKGSIGHPKTLGEFKNVLRDAGSKLVVVDFTATWCGPCQRIKPAFKSIAASNTDCVFIAVDVDENDETARFVLCYLYFVMSP
jgi:thiol:disulfide interchange protein